MLWVTVLGSWELGVGRVPEYMLQNISDRHMWSKSARYEAVGGVQASGWEGMMLPAERKFAWEYLCFTPGIFRLLKQKCLSSVVQISLREK